MSGAQETPPPTAGAGAPPGGPANPQIGEEVLGVRLLARLGAGNVATVWSGLDGEAPAAVKVLDPALAGEVAREAFARGARSMERLAALGDALPASVLRLRRSSPDGLELVTDLAEGSIVDLCALGWGPRESVAFFVEICRAIEAAHGAGVVHRCLKPRNVLVSQELTPLVGDFDLVDLPTLAAAEVSAGGYAAYAAPEELTGEGSGAPTADLYSLGRILHFLLLGQDPDEPAQEIPALWSLTGQPPELVGIVRKCTIRDPAARYQAVGELLADLARYERAQGGGTAGLEAGGGPPSWRGAARRGAEEPPPSVRRPMPSNPGAAEPPPSRRGLGSRLTIDPPAPLRWLSRRHELALAAAGAGVVAAAGATLAIPAIPPAWALHAAQAGGAAGAALLTLALPAAKHRLALARVALAAAAAVLVFLADPSQLATFRLRATLSDPEPAARAEAVKQLTRGGHRRFDGEDLSGLDLTGADLSAASFRGANLARANLGEAALMESAFEGADLTAAIVKGADLTRTDADAARGWDSAECDELTRLPDGWGCAGDHPARESATDGGPEPGGASQKP